MKKRITSLLVLVCLLVVPLGVQAANVGGEFVSELRLPIKNDEVIKETSLSLGTKVAVDGEFYDFGDWKLTLDVRFNETLRGLKSNVWKADDTDQVGESVSIELSEAYVDLYSVGYDAMDVRIGKQYVDLGVGDGITTFNLTKPVAANFIDELQNTRAVTGVKIDGYPEDFHVELFWQPKLTPSKTGGTLATVYDQVMQDAMADMKPMLEIIGQEKGIIIGGIDTTDPTKDGWFDFTLKAATLVGDYDLGVIYQKGHVSSPLTTGLDLDLIAVHPESGVPIMKLELEQAYLPLQKIGFTAEGALGDVGIWSELTYNIPKKDFFDFDLLGDMFEMLPEEYQFTDENYLTGLIGMDYFLNNGVYLNGQLVRGFPQEVTKNMLNTYLVGNISQDFMNNRLTLESSMIYSFGEKGWMMMPEAVYQINRNTKVFGKLAIPGGDEESLFKKMEDLTQVLVGVTIGF